MNNKRPPLVRLVERDKEKQNGFGYDEFCRIAKLLTRPSYKSVSLIFNRNERTIKSWFARWDEEEGEKK